GAGGLEIINDQAAAAARPAAISGSAAKSDRIAGDKRAAIERQLDGCTADIDAACEGVGAGERDGAEPIEIDSAGAGEGDVEDGVIAGVATQIGIGNLDARGEARVR